MARKFRGSSLKRGNMLQMYGVSELLNKIEAAGGKVLHGAFHGRRPHQLHRKNARPAPHASQQGGLLLHTFLCTEALRSFGSACEAAGLV